MTDKVWLSSGILTGTWPNNAQTADLDLAAGLPILNRILSGVLTGKGPRSERNAGVSTADRIQ